METTPINIRPFMPSLKDEEKDGREPFAILSFGNVTIELDYTIMNYLKLGVESDCFQKVGCVTNRAFEEIVKEMIFEMKGELPSYHRDTEEFKNLPFTHNFLSDHI